MQSSRICVWQASVFRESCQQESPAAGERLLESG
jgi:hypothetical protein